MRNLTATPGLLAIGCLLPVSGWWFMQMLLLPASPATAADSSMQAAQAIVLLQFLSVSLFVPQLNADSYIASTRRFALLEPVAPVAAFVLPAWPFLAMLSLGSGLSALDFAAAEAGVLVVGLTVALLARGLRFLDLGAEMNRLSQIFAGLVAASAVWMLRQDLLHWVGL